MISEFTRDEKKKLSRDAQTIIGRMISASKNLKLYPASHPITKRIMSASFSKLKDILKDNDYFSLSLAGNVLLINDEALRITNKQAIDNFLTVLGKRKIGKITFIKGVDMDEFRSLIELLGIEPEDIEKQGGLDTIVAQKNIRNISVFGISFSEKQEVKEAGMKWKDLLALIAGSDDFVKRIGKNPEEFSQTVRDSLKGEATGHGWGNKIKEAVGNIAERFFNMYKKKDIETYTDTISRLILVLTPEMQSELLFSKPEIPFWDDVVNKVVDKIAASELGDLIAKETKKQYETIVIGGEGSEEGGGDLGKIAGSARLAEGRGKGIGEGLGDGIGTGIGVGKGKETGLARGRGGGTGKGLDSGRGKGIGGGLGDGIGTGIGTGKGKETGLARGRGGGTGKGLVPGREGGAGKTHLSNINTFLKQFIEKNKRKLELLPVIRRSLEKEGVKESVFDYFSGGTARKEFLKVIESDLIKTGIDEESLIGIRSLIKKNAHIEELLKSMIDLLNNKKVKIRRDVVKSFVDLTDNLLLMGRMDLMKLIVVAFSDRLGKESDTGIFKAIVKALSTIALKLIKEGKATTAEMIDDILNNYLKTLEDKEKLKIVVGALSSIGDQKTLKYMIYAINRDVAYNIINAELSKKGVEIFPLLLHSMKTIADKITRLRLISLLIDTAKQIPNFDTSIKTYIEDSKWFVRRNIAIILGEIGGNKSLKLLSNLVKDEEPRVRVEVMESLGKIKTKDSEKLLSEGLADSDKMVVKKALYSLRKVGTKMSVFTLKKLLGKQPLLKKEEVLEIQELVISVLCSIGGNDIVDILRRVIFDKNIFGRYKYNDKIRLLSVEGLNKLNTDSSRQILARVSWLKNQTVGEKAAELLKREKIL